MTADITTLSGKGDHGARRTIQNEDDHAPRVVPMSTQTPLYGALTLALSSHLPGLGQR
ncbi:hypothetical protein [Mesorhizobium sp. Root552]|jgi:hypothetical protein|uniref:hypothetical protein n=1 Tax=Mesorhizobium sp. Root552 TaxID=1736555 RepID=UPI0012E7F509|nr:hypothetical protein [Mesorhizobium sp. Root552]